MAIFTIIMIAIGLAMDAFAVSISCGVSNPKTARQYALKVALIFGGFQGGMTALGWLVGLAFREYIEAYDHWVAFVLLSFIGFKMIKDAFSEENKDIDLASLKMLIVFGIATSIDALAAGISIATINIPIGYSVIVIGVITFSFCYIGVSFGEILGTWVNAQKKVDILGGCILILIGVKILIEHL